MNTTVSTIASSGKASTIGGRHYGIHQIFTNGNSNYYGD